MRLQKQKWTAEEEEALKAGVAKHGAGKWKNILVDLEFAPKLSNRSNIDLKDKWRNMAVSHRLGTRDNTTTPKAKATASSAGAPKGQNNPSISSSKVKANDNPHSQHDMKTASKYNAMIFEALSSLKDPRGSDIDAIGGFIEQKYAVPESFRRILIAKLKRLVKQGKLEKDLQRYKINDTALGTNTPTPKQKDVRTRPPQQSTSATSGKIIEDAAKAAARWIAQAENDAFLTAVAVEESQRVTQMAEDAHAMLTLSKELFVQCSQGEYILLC